MIPGWEIVEHKHCAVLIMPFAFRGLLRGKYIYVKKTKPKKKQNQNNHPMI